jgi:hypothetical protein
MSDVRQAGRGHFLATTITGAAMSAKVIREVCLMMGLVIALVVLRAVLS